MQREYTTMDVGCYVDGARGIYAVEAIVDFARSHGAVIERDDQTCFESEYEDEADDYMNADYPVDGCFWGRNDNGDWGLWPYDDE